MVERQAITYDKGAGPVRESHREAAQTGFLRYLCLLCAALLLIGCCAVRVGAAGYVFDKAGLFSGSEAAQLSETAAKLEETYNMNFLMLTVEDAQGHSSRDVAERFYENGGYDSDGKKGGILLLIDLDNRELNLVTNGEMILYITDAREERIYDAGYEYAAEGDYGGAMIAMLEQTASYMKKGIPDNQYTYDTETGQIVRRRSISTGDLLLAVGVAFGCALSACVFLYRRYRRVEQYEYSIGQNADIRVTGKEDRLVNQFVTHRKIPKDPPPGGGSGGSSGGRSSTHTSSGGGTYGGGHGRNF